MMYAVLLLWMTSASVLPQVAADTPKLALEIRVEQVNPHAGDEILVTFVITNVGTSSYQYDGRNYDHSGRMPEYRLSAYDERGTPVSDPQTRSRVSGRIGGGLGQPSELQPGQRFSQTIALNLWAFVVDPGVYTVRGSYWVEDSQGRSVESAPVTVRVLPRNNAEMGRYVEQLAARLTEAASTPDTRSDLVRRLTYTGNRRAAASLLAMPAPDSNTAFWIGMAFRYLPHDAAMLTQALSAIQSVGLSSARVVILEELSATPAQMRQVIGEALAGQSVDEWSAAAWAAQRYPDDGFTPRLIELATGRPATDGRLQAIGALAWNRTDAGVAVLTSLRQDSDPAIRRWTEVVIEGAYHVAGTTRGRPLRVDDFPDISRRR